MVCHVDFSVEALPLLVTVKLTKRPNYYGGGGGTAETLY